MSHWARNRMTGRWSTAVSTAALAGLLLCLIPSSAGARVVLDKVTGQRFGFVPAPTAAVTRNHRSGLAGTPTCDTSVDPTCASAMTLHSSSGVAVQHAENDYLFFWDPQGFSESPGYISDMQTWLSNVAAGDYSTGSTGVVGNPISVVQQYYDMSGPGGTKSFVPYAVRNAGTIVDTDPFPASGCTDSYKDFYAPGQPTVTLATCLTAPQLIGELANYITAHHLPKGMSNEYFILTPPNNGSCDDGTSKACAISTYCGWHTAIGSGASQIVLADLPWLQGTTCDVNRAETVGGGLSDPYIYSSGIDSVVGVFSHELSETMTDPVPGTGWFGPGGGADEIGDKCAYQYEVGGGAFGISSLPKTGGGSYYNTTLGSNNYLLQMEYDNRAGGCNQWDTDTQPTASLTAPSSATTNAPASFSLSSVTAPAGIAYVTWNYGDGSAPVVTTNAAAVQQHAFTTAGTYTVSAVVTDNDGNELNKTAQVVVTGGSGGSNAIQIHPPTSAHVNQLFAIGLTGTAAQSETLYMYVDYYTCSSTPAGEHAKGAPSNHWTVSGSFHELSKGWKASKAHVYHVCAYLVKAGEPLNPSAGVLAHAFANLPVT